MKQSAPIFFSVFLFFAVFVLPMTAQALELRPLVPCGISEKATPGLPASYYKPCSICHVTILLDNIIDFLIYYVAIPGAGIMIAVGGFMILIGAGSESRVGAGKKMITNAVIGLIIVLGGWLIVDTGIKVLTGDRSAENFVGTLGPWNAPKCSL